MLSEEELKFNEAYRQARHERRSPEAILKNLLALGLCAAERADYLHSNSGVDQHTYRDWSLKTFNERRAADIDARSASLLAEILMASRISSQGEIETLIQSEFNKSRKEALRTILLGTAGSVLAVVVVAVIGWVSIIN